MKLAAATNHFQSFGAQEAVEMVIRADAKTVRTLIDGMYSDKFGAIVRELATNGWDSNIEAGAPERAIFVHCPHELNPMFYVRDYGAGMDHEKMTGLYGVIGASDKDHANDMAGGFGLGRLSPLAIVDQYSVTCYDGDIARNYTVAYNERGMPVVLYTGATPSTEPRGVRVGFVCEKSMFGSFKARIAKVARGFEPGALDSNVPAAPLGEPVLQGDGWRRFRNSGLAQWNVRMGCVIYPLVADAQLLELPEDPAGEWVIEVPIGAVTLPRSREGIEYTEANCAYIAARINQIKAEVDAQMRALVEGIPDFETFQKTLREARPGFYEEVLVHGPSGLTGDKWEFLDEKTFLFKGEEGYEGAWEYEEHRAVPFTTGMRPKYVFRDVDRLLSEEEVRAKAIEEKRFKIEGGLTYTERRRLARWWRSLCEFSYDAPFDEGEEDILGDLGEIGGWLLVTRRTDEELATILKTVPKEITWDQIQAALDWFKPEKKPRPAIFDGVCALSVEPDYLGDTYKQEPISEAVFEDNACWWPRVGLAGGKAAAMTRIAAFFGLKLYSVAAGSRKVVIEAELPSLTEALDQKIRAIGGAFTWEDYRGACVGYDSLNPLSGNKAYFPVFRRIHERAPELYQSLKRCPGLVGFLARQHEPYFKPEAVPFVTAQSREARNKVDHRFGELVLNDLKVIPPRTAQEHSRPLAPTPQGSQFVRAHNKVYEPKTPEAELIHGLLVTASKVHGEAFISIAETLLKLGRRHAKKLPIPRLIKA